MRTNKQRELALVFLLFLALSSGHLRGETLDVAWVTNAHRYAVTCVSFAKDGISMGSASLDATARIWAVSNVSLLRLIGTDAAMYSVALSSNGAYAVTGDSAGQIRMWRMSDGARIWGNTSSKATIYGLSFSPDNTLVTDARGRYDVAVGFLLTHKSSDGLGTPFVGHDGPVYAAAFSPGGDILASGSQDQTARLWRVSDATLLRTLSAHSNSVYSVDFSPDGSLLATASTDGTARLWRVSDGEVVRVIEGGGGKAARFSADGKLLLTVNAGTIKLWRVADGCLLRTYAGLDAGPLAVSPDGKYFAYGTSSGAVVLARMPVVLSPPGRANQEIRLEWQGGTGLYQVQQATNATSPAWQNLGLPTTNTSTNVLLTATNTFFRIQSLTNAP